MSDFHFAKDVLKRSLNLVRTVKPSVGDVSFRFTNDGLTLFSFDNRRYVRVEVKPAETENVPEDFQSDEFYIFLEKVGIFETELDSIKISVKDESLDIKTSGNGQSRKSSLKKRSVKSKRPDVPEFPNVDLQEFSKSSFDELLRCISCSASIKDGKTEDDMRIMQVHFYDNGYVVSSTRYHASVASVIGINLNTSIISADIPAIRSFLSKMDNDKISFGQDSNKIYFVDSNSRSFLALSKVAGEKPEFQPMVDGFEDQIVIDRELLLRNLNWATLAIERTQRITIEANKSGDDSGNLVISFQKQEADGIPISVVKGNGFKIDVPLDKISHIINFIDNNVSIKYGNPKSSTMLEISSGDNSGDVKCIHFITTMKNNEL